MQTVTSNDLPPGIAFAGLQEAMGGPLATEAVAADRAAFSADQAPTSAIAAVVAAFEPAQAAAIAAHRIGGWLSAALDDPSVCEDMKNDIRAWLNAGSPSAPSKPLSVRLLTRGGTMVVGTYDPATWTLTMIEERR